jgi:hypothetical protein
MLIKASNYSVFHIDLYACVAHTTYSNTAKPSGATKLSVQRGVSSNRRNGTIYNQLGESR